MVAEGGGNNDDFSLEPGIEASMRRRLEMAQPLAAFQASVHAGLSIAELDRAFSTFLTELLGAYQRDRSVPLTGVVVAADAWKVVERYAVDAAYRVLLGRIENCKSTAECDVQLEVYCRELNKTCGADFARFITNELPISFVHPLLPRVLANELHFNFDVLVVLPEEELAAALEERVLHFDHLVFERELSPAMELLFRRVVPPFDALRRPRPKLAHLHPGVLTVLVGMFHDCMMEEGELVPMPEDASGVLTGEEDTFFMMRSEDGPIQWACAVYAALWADRLLAQSEE